MEVSSDALRLGSTAAYRATEKHHSTRRTALSFVTFVFPFQVPMTGNPQSFCLSTGRNMQLLGR